MSTEDELFAIDVRTLYEKTKRDVYSVIDDADDEKVLNALFSLNHLRDWIHPEGLTSYENKSADELTPEETIHKELHVDRSYNVVRELCNRAKHVKRRKKYKTKTLIGFIPGLSVAGDRLGQKNYLVDDEDLRNILQEVLSKYETYFENG